jgi:hypothetical protein
MKVKARRPLAIVACYFDENGSPQEKELYDFEARVFCHEYDHLAGIPFIHWKVSEGEIELFSNEGYENLYFTIEHYKHRLRDSKITNPDYFHYFDNNLINSDKNEFLDDQLMLDNELRNKNKLSYDDVMLVDIEKAIKKDLKLKLKRETREDVKH